MMEVHSTSDGGLCACMRACVPACLTACLFACLRVCILVPAAGYASLLRMLLQVPSVVLCFLPAPSAL